MPSKTKSIHLKCPVRFSVFVICIIMIIVLIICNHRTAKADYEYIPYVVSKGEYYWNIARKLQDKGYHKDVRDIVMELENKSGINADYLKPGDTIFIPKLDKH